MITFMPVTLKPWLTQINLNYINDPNKRSIRCISVINILNSLTCHNGDNSGVLINISTQPHY